ncbi:hypothetical protein DFJ74DRAFT_657501 [Hyaloraphidium curvatum]|nr:hypothetical protein DFJ74DRAFT_657501 [Hyaloraphidium curvatum]
MALGERFADVAPMEVDGKESAAPAVMHVDSKENTAPPAQPKLVIAKEEARLHPRAYQLNVFEVAKTSNVVAVLPTGAGKTLISCLLVKHTLDIARSKPSAPKLVFFLVNLVPLVFQQSDVLRRHCDTHVKSYCGEMDVDSWNGPRWKSNLEETNVHCMTAAIFLNIISCGFVRMKDIALLILDECHHAKRKHPYNVIFDTYYRTTPLEERPKVFGMTASPIVGKQDIQVGLTQLQSAINCQIITCDENEIAAFVARAKERLVWFDKYDESVAFPLFDRLIAAADLASQRFAAANVEDPPKVFLKLVADAREIMVALGTRAADIYLRESLPELQNWIRRYYARNRTSEPFLDELINSVRPTAREPTPLHFLRHSPKVQKLMEQLVELRQQPEYCGIIFVERRATAWALAAILRREIGSSVGVIVGHGSAGAFEENTRGQAMDYRVQNEMIRKFRKGEITTLVATAVAEEGLDIKPCQLVIRFDLPKTLISYIQSRGRARHLRSQYLLFAENANENDIKQLSDLKNKEIVFNKSLAEGTPFLEDDMQILHDPADVLHNPETGAYLPLSLAVARLELFCARLGGDRYYSPRPLFRFGTEPVEAQEHECSVRIPSTNLPEALRQWFSAKRRSRSIAKAAAAMSLLRVLRDLGYLDENLLPPKPDPDPKDLLELEEEERFIAPAVPKLWAQATPWSHVPGSTNMTYLNVIERKGSAQTIGLLTRYAFPREVKIPLFVDGENTEPFSVKTVRSEEISSEKLDMFMQWSALVWNTVLKRRPVAQSDPMEVDGEAVPARPVYSAQEDPAILLVCIASDHRDGIDVERMRMHLGYANNPILVSELVGRSDMEYEALRNLRDVILEDTVGTHPQKYLYRYRCERLTPHMMLDPFKPDLRVCSAYMKSHNIPLERIDPNQSVYLAQRLPRKLDYLQPDRASRPFGPFPQPGMAGAKRSSDRYVFPQYLKVNPLEKELVDFAFFVPSVIEFLKLNLLARELNDRNGLFFRECPEELVPAMTLAKSSLLGLKESNLERLEFLGDAHIKFFTTTRTFVKDRGYAQGSLTRRRNFLVSNTFLGRKIIQMDPQWPASIAAGKCSLKWKEWRPPKLKPDADTQVNLSIKTLADTVEAVVGACYLRDEAGADRFLARVFDLEATLPTDLSEEFVLQQCGLDAPYDLDSPDQHPKLSRVPLVESILGYTFRSKLLCLSALTHESAIDTMVRSYERLEFLGDAILSTMVTSLLFEHFSHATPGTLTALREVAICNNFLAMLCVRLGLHVHLDHGSGALLHAVGDYCDDLEQLERREPLPEKRDPQYGHLAPDPKLRWMSLQAPKALADIVESMLGAVYLDSGFSLRAVERVFKRVMLPLVEKNIDPRRPPRHPVQLVVQVLLARRCRGLKFTWVVRWCA